MNTFGARHTMTRIETKPRAAKEIDNVHRSMRIALVSVLTQSRNRPPLTTSLSAERRGRNSFTLLQLVLRPDSPW